MDLFDLFGEHCDLAPVDRLAEVSRDRESDWELRVFYGSLSGPLYFELDL